MWPALSSISTRKAWSTAMLSHLTSYSSSINRKAVLISPKSTCVNHISHPATSFLITPQIALKQHRINLLQYTNISSILESHDTPILPLKVSPWISTVWGCSFWKLAFGPLCRISFQTLPQPHQTLRASSSSLLRGAEVSTSRPSRLAGMRLKTSYPNGPDQMLCIKRYSGKCRKRLTPAALLTRAPTKVQKRLMTLRLSLLHH